jgi:hypothetical protein
MAFTLGALGAFLLAWGAPGVAPPSHSWGAETTSVGVLEDFPPSLKDMRKSCLALAVSTAGAAGLTGAEYLQEMARVRLT